MNVAGQPAHTLNLATITTKISRSSPLRARQQWYLATCHLASSIFTRSVRQQYIAGLRSGVFMFVYGIIHSPVEINEISLDESNLMSLLGLRRIFISRQGVLSCV